MHIYELQKLRGNWLWPRFRLANHVVLIARFQIIGEVGYFGKEKEPFQTQILLQDLRDIHISNDWMALYIDGRGSDRHEFLCYVDPS